MDVVNVLLDLRGYVISLASWEDSAGHCILVFMVVGVQQRLDFAGRRMKVQPGLKRVVSR